MRLSNDASTGNDAGAPLAGSTIGQLEDDAKTGRMLIARHVQSPADLGSRNISGLTEQQIASTKQELLRSIAKQLVIRESVTASLVGVAIEGKGVLGPRLTAEPSLSVMTPAGPRPPDAAYA